MKVIRGLHNLQSFPYGCAITIGNFDGIHLAHKHLLLRLKELSSHNQIPTVVIIFEPQPQEFFQGTHSPARLTNFREKIISFMENCVDYVVCVHFNKKLSDLTPFEFIQKILLSKFNVRYMVVGDDFRFGKSRAGDIHTLRTFSKREGFKIEVVENIKISEQRISSSAVRTFLEKGDMDQARKFLGHDYRICGKVIHGYGKGQDLGWPTANIALKRTKAAISGVFAVSVKGSFGRKSGVANVGNRPTFKRRTCLLEVYLLDFSGNLYGEYLEVNFLRKFRDEKRFESIDSLRDQIGKDVIRAKEYFGII